MGLAGSLSAQAAPDGDQTMLSPGDSVRIVVWRKPEFSGDFVVATDGSVTHPLFKDVKIAGVPLATAEANVRRYLSQYDQILSSCWSHCYGSRFRVRCLDPRCSRLNPRLRLRQPLPAPAAPINSATAAASE